MEDPLLSTAFLPTIGTTTYSKSPELIHPKRNLALANLCLPVLPSPPSPTTAILLYFYEFDFQRFHK